ncbi:protein-lysine N-methyltransferase EEF2KMT [Cryptosporidium felis]|nr:protein-lysine N-methyltransferase EEF2KMT [Cryptosporidium felis]
MERLKSAILSLQSKETVISICRDVYSLNSEHFQKELIDIFNCKLLKKYPLPSIYLRNIIRNIIEYIESTENETLDELYFELSKTFNSNGSNLITHFVILVPNIYCQLNPFLGKSNGSFEFVFGFEDCNLVGMRPWSAGYYLAEWLIFSAKLDRKIVNSDIIELGSGVGIASIIPYLLLPISSICSTDNDPRIIHNLKYNYFVNGITLSPVESDHCEDSFKERIARVMCLDWETTDINIARELVKSSRNPVIISSDVIYDDNLTLLFVNSLKHLLASSYEKVFGSLPKKSNFQNLDSSQVKWDELPEADFKLISTYAVSVNTFRNQQTIQFFVDKCIENGLTVSRDYTNIPRIFNSEIDSKMITFIISL